MDVFLAHRLDVEQRAAVREPELAVVGVVDAAAEVHEVMGRADVELEVLHDRGYVGGPELQGALRAPRVDRAGCHPLLDRDRFHLLAGPAGVHEGHTHAILQVPVQQPLAAEHR